MFHVFGRHSDEGHAFQFALRGLLERSDVFTAEDRAVAFNLMDEGRVSAEREAAFTAYTGDAPSSRQLRDGMVDYFWTEIRSAARPAFVKPGNQNNRIVFGMGLPGKAGFHPGHDLARVLNLTGLKAVFLRNLRAFPEFRQLEGHEDDAEYFRRWLSDQCTGPAGGRHLFVDATLRMLNEDRRKHRYHPVWATRWDLFELFVGEGANRWRQVFGVRPEPEPPSWLLVLKYKATEAGELYRPTQLDAGWYGFHFPPPELEGYAMDLAGAADQLVPEYIHEQTDHSVGHWIDAGRLLDRADMTDPIGLPEQRERHHALLMRVHGEAAGRWRY